MKKVIEYIKKNWLLLAFGILIGGLIISDMLDQFVWKTGMMFRPNSMYMSFVYIVIFMVGPLIVIENVFKDKYKDIELEEYKDKCESPKDVGRIIVSGVGKIALIIGSVFGMFWLVGTMQETMLESVIDTSKPYIFISNFSHLPVATGLGIFVLFVWMFSKKGIVSRDLSDGGKTDFFAAGERARLPLKVKCGIAGCALIVFVFSIGATMLSYDCVTEEGVKIVKLFPCDSTDALLHLVYEASFDPDEGLVMCDMGMADAVAYACASLLYSLFEKHDAAKSFISLAMALCGGNENVKR